MSLQEYNVDAVLHLSSSYLETVLRRYLREGDYSHTNLGDFGGIPGCLDTGGNSIRLGSHPEGEPPSFLRADDVVYQLGDISFRFVDRTTYATAVLERIGGELESGTAQDQLQPVSSFELEGELRIEQSQGQGAEPRLVFDLNSISPSVDIPLDEFDVGGETLQLADDPGRVKVLTDGNLAVGLSLSVGGDPAPYDTDFDRFLGTYDQTDSIDLSRDQWAMVLDEWIIAEFVDEVDIGRNRSSLRNTSQHLHKIDSGGIVVKGAGEYEWGIGWDFTFTATLTAEVAQKGTANSHVELNWHLDKADASSLVGDTLEGLARLFDEFDVPGRGTKHFQDSAFWGDRPDPLGRLFVLDFDTQPGSVVFSGSGTKEAESGPVAQVIEEEIVFGRPCSNRPDQEAEISLRNPTDMPLSVCDIRLTGQDSWAFELDDSWSSARQLAPGGTHDVRVSPDETLELGSTYRARLQFRTNDDIVEVNLQAFYREPRLGGFPEQIRMVGRQERVECSNRTIEETDETFEIVNAGEGAVEVCRIDIQNESGGEWSWSGRQRDDPFGQQKVLKAGYILEPHSGVDLTVNFQPDSLDETETAILVVETSEGTRNIDMEAEVKEAESGDHYRLGGTLGGHSPEICADLGESLRRVELGERLGGIVDGVWDPMDPGCCPGNQQPYCLCSNFLEVDFQGTPPPGKLRAEDRDGSFFEAEIGESNSAVLVPFPGEPGPSFNFEPSEEVEGPVKAHLRRWQFSRVGRWETDARLVDLAIHGDRVVATDGRMLQAIRINKSGLPRPDVRSESTDPSARVDAFGDQLLVSGDGHARMTRLADGGFESTPVEVDADFQYLISLDGLASVRSGEVLHGSHAVAVGDESLTFMRIDASGRFSELSAVEVENSPTMTAFGDGHLVAASDAQLSRFSVSVENGLNPAGKISLEATARGVVQFSDALYVFDDEQRLQFVRENPDGSISHVGQAGFPHHDDPADLLPAGGFHVLDGRLVSRRYPSDGINVFEFERGEFSAEAETN